MEGIRGGVLRAEQGGLQLGPLVPHQVEPSHATASEARIEVVIPTRNRPARLRRCLESIRAEGPLGARIPVLVCDSSTGPDRDATADVAAFYGARYAHHQRPGAAGGRNECARLAQGELLVSVDDDVYVQAGALQALARAALQAPYPSVVSGTVQFGPTHWSGPGVRRLTGYGRAARPGEAPDYLISAFFAYPKAVALNWPWNEGLLSTEDLFMGSVWRHQGVAMRFVPEAQAVHDEEVHSYGPEHNRYRTYVNLADAIYGRKSLVRLLCFECLGFLLALKQSGVRKAGTCVRLWIVAHRDFLRDRHKLRTTWFRIDA